MSDKQYPKAKPYGKYPPFGKYPTKPCGLTAVCFCRQECDLYVSMGGHLMFLPHHTRSGGYCENSGKVYRFAPQIAAEMESWRKEQ